MPVNLNNIIKVKVDNRDLNDAEYSERRQFIIDSQTEPDILPDIELEKNIRSMLERWGVTGETGKQELILVFTKTYRHRLNTKASRAFWRLLRHNINNILV